MVKEFIQKAIARGDQAVNDIANELLMNETFSAAIERALTTKGVLDRKVRVILNSMNLASKIDLDEIHDEFRQIRRELRGIQRKLESLEKSIGEQK